MEPLVTTKEVADFLGVSPRTVEAWVQARKIPHYKFGRPVRFRLSEVEEWLKKQRVVPVMRRSK